ncbi:MAG: TolC family protein, partial [Acidobacteria bacterium]
DDLPYAALEGMTLDSALRLARESREDLRAATTLVSAAEAHREAAVGTALPTLRFNAEVGRSSNSWDSLLPTYAVSATINVPVFQGGRVKGRNLQADAQLQQQRAQLQDLQARVEYEVRGAWLDLQAADQRVGVARSAADVANQQLVQAQDRFAAGVTSNIEVVQAQEAVATATENFISALSAHNLAKFALARASGVSEEQATTTGRTR